MTKCLLFFSSLCLLAFVAFSSTSPCQNPRNSNRQVFDTLGRGINPRSNYRIASSLGGVLSGHVYLGHIPNSGASCPDGVFKYNSDGQRGTPLRFIEHSCRGQPPLIYENQDINIQFVGSRNCDNFVNWKVGEYNATLEASLFGTRGGTIGRADSSWFKIVRAERGYHLLNCPGPFVCPNCALNQCRVVWVIVLDGRRRLALATRQTPSQGLRFPLSVYFVRA
ncbi:hypothetical protein KY290_018406 [Solanum tuberosum]|uniref:Uncharacterized protein n=2 Tax=Solanum tuberosum TaxID=4113 RepID=A0ABQ7VE30_SOLTU|nr:PREDICTED: aspartic protease inhibitor 11-like [Solanum tuberosum]KAH0686415.1 hypothetical protein KY284_016968 [Solanum tuberosum]KAH0703076.1 hypothetical protein KY285_017354 [Solanum tuberosum]KAH0762333.1 hypothetical protein KY290_018406 [Solanum tuberosum]